MEFTIQYLSALAKLMQDNGLGLLELADGEQKIHLEKQAAESAGETAARQQALALPEGKPPESDAVDFNKILEVKSPLVGVFYRAPSPEAKPFVELGSKVKKGDTLGMIETMKLMNEIKAEREGEIVDICVQDGQVVEFSQVLFKLF